MILDDSGGTEVADGHCMVSYIEVHLLYNTDRLLIIGHCTLHVCVYAGC